MSSPPSPLATPPSRRSKVSTLCLLPAPGDDREDPTPSPSPHKKRHLHFSPDNLPLRELLRLSHVENPDPNPPRGRSKVKSTKPLAAAVPGHASPRSARRPRGRPAKAPRTEDASPGFFEEELVKVRRRRTRRRSRDRSVALADAAPTLPDHSRCPERALAFLHDLLLWKDPARSSLWFGFGSLCVLSSCFSGNVSFNFVSALSHAGLLVLALAFFRDSFFQRSGERTRPQFELKEEDVLRTLRLVLPAANAAIELALQVFSGEPSMTLKVAPTLLFLAKYSHFITPWRFLAIGFFVSFTVPMLLSCHSHRIHKHVESIKSHLLEAWAACRHKRVVSLACGALFWNMFGFKARIITAFLAVVVIRYHHHQKCIQEVERVEEAKGEGDQEDLVVIVDEKSKKEA